jgi:hypothetical protein
MNKCAQVRELLALRSRDWESDARICIAEHLETCADCAALVQTYGEQDRLLVDMPRLRFTPERREQLVARARGEARRRQVRTRLFSALGTAAALVVLAAFALALYLLFGGEEMPETGGVTASSVAPTLETPAAIFDSALTTPTPTGGAVATPSFPVFSDEVRINGLALQASTGEVFGWGLDEYGVDSPPFLGTFTVPITLAITLNWQVLDLPSAEWVAFLHWTDGTGQLVRASDVAVEWPNQTCPADTYDSGCIAKTEFGWSFPADFPAGQYALVVGLYDREGGQRAPVTEPEEMSPPQIPLGSVQLVSAESASPTVTVTLRIRSGRPNPFWLLAPEQEAELGDILSLLPRSDQPLDAIGSLGYSGFYLELPGLDDHAPQKLEVWRGVVRSETNGQTQVLTDSDRSLERWLIETGQGEVDDAVLEMAREDLGIATAVPEDGLAIYLTDPKITPELIADIDLDGLLLEQEPILSQQDIQSYAGDTHELYLVPSAYERLNRLDVPVTGRSFVVAVGTQRIYSGAFWSPASSLIFDGAVILLPATGETLRIQLGYPEASAPFLGEDPRADSRIMESLEGAGKLQ